MCAPCATRWRLSPTVRGAHTYLGLDDLQKGRLTEAESEFEAELAVDPNYLTAIAGLGEVRYRQERWPEAADLLLKSRTKDSRTTIYALRRTLQIWKGARGGCSR